MDSWTTKAGTKLPIRLLKGKEYLDVQWRVLWMREDHPDWSIETECVLLTEKEAVVKASVRDAAGKVISQAMKRETPQSFPAGHIEKAETGAIGRALGFAGFGTQFAQDLDEPDAEGNDNPSIADAPQDPRDKSQGAASLSASGPVSTLGAYVIKVGEHKGKRLDSIGQHDLNGWIQYWQKRGAQGPLLEAVQKAEEYLKSVELPRAK